MRLVRLAGKEGGRHRQARGTERVEASGSDQVDHSIQKEEEEEEEGKKEEKVVVKEGR